MPCVVIVSGLPGTGRAEMAKYISTKLEIPIISADRLRPATPPLAGDVFDDVSIDGAKMNAMVALAQPFIEAGEPVILEASFDKYHEPYLRDEFTARGYSFVTVNMKTTPAEAYKRYADAILSSPGAKDVAKYTYKRFRELIAARGVEKFGLGRIFDINVKRAQVDAVPIPYDAICLRVAKELDAHRTVRERIVV